MLFGPVRNQGSFAPNLRLGAPDQTLTARLTSPDVHGDSLSGIHGEHENDVNGASDDTERVLDSEQS